MKASTILSNEINSNHKNWQHAKDLYMNNDISHQTFNDLSMIYRNQIQTLERLLNAIKEVESQ